MAKKGQASGEVDDDTPKQVSKKPRTGNTKANGGTGSGTARKKKATEEVAGDEEDSQVTSAKNNKKKGGSSGKGKKGKAVNQGNEESAITVASGEADDADEEIIDRGAISKNPDDSAVPASEPQSVAPQDATKAQPQEEEEDEALEDDVVAKPSQTIGREETKALLDTFDEITLSRYEVFRRAHLTKATMKKIVSNLVGPIPASVAIGNCMLLFTFL